MAMERDFTKTGWGTVIAGNRCTFTPPSHSRHAYVRKERFPSQFLDIDSPSYKPAAERHGTEIYKRHVALPFDLLHGIWRGGGPADVQELDLK